jgi:hypothetical protein
MPYTAPLQVMKLDELAGKSPQEVADIWIQCELDTQPSGESSSRMVLVTCQC